MTFKGARYETLLEIEQLLIAGETKLKVLSAKLQAERMQCSDDSYETEIRLNVQKKYLEEINEYKNTLIMKMDIFASELNDIEAQIFYHKFILGTPTLDIPNELGVSTATLYRNLDSIKKELEETRAGKDIETMLKK